MASLKTFFGALALVLMLWTGGVAHAAEPIDCIPATTQSAGHYEGDGDQRPSDRDQGVTHHHTGCSGHQLAAPAEQPAVNLHYPSAGVLLQGRPAVLNGHDPDRQLRPPIA